MSTPTYLSHAEQERLNYINGYDSTLFGVVDDLSAEVEGFDDLEKSISKEQFELGRIEGIGADKHKIIEHLEYDVQLANQRIKFLLGELESVKEMFSSPEIKTVAGRKGLEYRFLYKLANIKLKFR